MKVLAALFGKSPFRPLQAHMEKARDCVERLPPLFAAIFSGDETKQEKLVEEICRLESEADEIKNDVRNHLPKSLFLPVDRHDLLEILNLQDSIADRSQDIAVTTSLRKSSTHPDLREPLENLVTEVTQVCSHAADIIQELDELLETVFSGKEAEKVLKMIDQLDTDETITDDLGIGVARKLFALESAMSPLDIMFWFGIIRQVGELGNVAESIGNRLRLLLAK